MQAKAGVAGALQPQKADERGSMGLTSRVVHSRTGQHQRGLCNPKEAITTASSHGEEAHRSSLARLCRRQHQQGVLAAAQIAVGLHLVLRMQQPATHLSNSLHAGVPPDPGSLLFPLQHRTTLPSAISATNQSSVASRGKASYRTSSSYLTRGSSWSSSDASVMRTSRACMPDSSTKKLGNDLCSHFLSAMQP